MKVLAIIVLLFSCAPKRTSEPLATVTTANQVTTTPVDLKAKSEVNAIKLSWSEYEGASSYNIYFSTEKGVTKESYQIARYSKTNYEHRYLNIKDTYYYRIAAVTQNGESALSEEVSSTPLEKPSSDTTKKNHDVTEAAISESGNTIAFISDKCGQKSCIYISYKIESIWQKPVDVKSYDLEIKDLYLNEDGSHLIFFTPQRIYLLSTDDSNWREDVRSTDFVEPSGQFKNDIFYVFENNTLSRLHVKDGSFFSTSIEKSVEDYFPTELGFYFIKNKMIHKKEELSIESLNISADSIVGTDDYFSIWTGNELKHYEESKDGWKDVTNETCCIKKPDFLKSFPAYTLGNYTYTLDIANTYQEISQQVESSHFSENEFINIKNKDLFAIEIADDMSLGTPVQID